MIYKFVSADSMNAKRSIMSRLTKCNEYEKNNHVVSVAELKDRGCESRENIQGNYAYPD